MAKNILLHVTGSISAYKACALVSLLTKKGYDVRVMPSHDSLEFVGAASFEGLSHHKVETAMFGNDDPIPHIHLAQNWADLILVYPASADCINRMACGLSDDLFGAVFLANNFQKPVLIAPAMNTNMFRHPAVQESIQKLERWGCVILPCGEGELACGTKGEGRLIEPQEAFEWIEKSL